MRIAVGQINATVGGFDRNVARIVEAADAAQARGAEIVVLPEQAVPGYPARDFLEQPAFVEENLRAYERLRERTRQLAPALFAGYAAPHQDAGLGLYNAAAFLEGGRAVAVAHKMLLPTYDVFDEARYFDAGTEVRLVDYRGVRIGLTVCEDIWNDATFWRKRRYDHDPVEEAVAAGAQVILNASASPYALGKPALREEMLGACARRHGVPVVWCNLVGGNDSLVFDGRSLVLAADGTVLTRGRAFEEDLLVADVEPARRGGRASRAPSPPLRSGADPAADPDDQALDELLGALTLGLRDYVEKTGFERVVLGISGGIDSALTAAIAVRALGRERVLGVSMPSRYTSSMSVEDAAALASNLGIDLRTLPVEPAFEAFRETLAPVFAGRTPGLAYENLQARTRGVLLMAVSNELGALVLTTGNKSELAVGYCTLYGDMAGGLGVIGDLPKTTVYALARYINRAGEVIPARTIERPPSAELREGQTDQDSLPPYDVLDRILHAYVVERLGAEAIVARGEDEAVVRRVISLVLASEHKRWQAAPCLRVTSRAFGEGWKFPIAHGYRP